jgi:hypothetical protein
VAQDNLLASLEDIIFRIERHVCTQQNIQLRVVDRVVSRVLTEVERCAIERRRMSAVSVFNCTPADSVRNSSRHCVLVSDDLEALNAGPGSEGHDTSVTGRDKIAQPIDRNRAPNANDDLSEGEVIVKVSEVQ